MGDEFARLVGDDELCAAVRLAVEGSDEDALRRLGFGGFGGYAQRLSELMSDSVREGHDPQAEDFAAIMEEVARPVHYAHHLVNEAGTAVQLAKDEPLGIHIKPQEADFDDDALKSTVGNAASMDTPEKTVEALAEGLAYAVKKTGNDFIKANAEAHSRAGFEVKVKRSGSTKCCPWCAARIGSWAIANAPNGVFGCHANCSCTVEYTSSTGAKTSARGANLHHYGAGAFVEVEYEPPHVLSREEAREKGGFDEPKRLGEKLSRQSENHAEPTLTSAKPTLHSEKDYINIEAYARERGIRIYNIGRFDGDTELLKEQIDAIDEARKEFGLTNHTLSIRFGTIDDPNQDLAETNNRGDCIEFNYFALRDRKTTENFMNSDNSLAATKAAGIAFHEMGHIISIKRGEIGLDIAAKAYYNIFKKEPTRSELLEYLEKDISDYSVTLHRNANKPYRTKDFKEITPEIYSKDKTGPSDFTNEFVRLLKEAYGL